MNIIFITGTDTDAGKTMLSLLVMHALHGRDAVYLKPVQTGCSDPDTDSDPAFVHRHLPDGLPTTPAQAIHACRVPPKAPLFAGEPVDFQAAVNFVLAHAAWYSWTVVEGAGGVLVPVTSEKTMLDLALETKASILVAGRAGLGTINHTLLTLEAIRARQGSCLGVFLLDPDDATPEAEQNENIRAISGISGFPVHGVIGRIDNPLHPPASVLAMIHRVLATRF